MKKFSILNYKASISDLEYEPDEYEFDLEYEYYLSYELHTYLQLGRHRKTRPNTRPCVALRRPKSKSVTNVHTD